MVPRLYAITDSRQLLAPDWLEPIEAALRGGCGWVQYRDKSSDSQRRLQQACALRQLCDDYQAKCLINDDPALARRSQAHGVHLGQGDMPIAEARQLLGPAAIIGATCHASLELAQQSAAAGADYLAFGRFFPSNTKPDASPAPIGLLAGVRRITHLPIVVIGGINLSNAQALLQAGADSLAVCEGLFAAADIQDCARQFLQL